MQRLNHTSSTRSNIAVRRDNAPQNHNVWHYHEELEFIYIRGGKGTFFVGDCIQQFSENFTVLIVSSTLHYWLLDDEYFNENVCSADIHGVHFKPDFMGADFLEISESTSIKQVYRLAKQAIVFPPNDSILLQF